MFTGIIEEIGTVSSCSSTGKMVQATISAKKVLEETKIGDSVAISGVCQTVTEIGNNCFTVQISSTTMKKTTLKNLLKLKHVNLERAMRLNDRLGGHLVQGHINDTATIKEIKPDSSMYLIVLKLPSYLMKFITDEGSVTVDGISLTVSEKNPDKGEIAIRIIPQTFDNTILKFKQSGEKVNIETDMICRYLDSLLSQKKEDKLTIHNLEKWGY